MASPVSEKTDDQQNNAGKAYKTCPVCKKNWADREDFISDPQIKLLGYQANFNVLTLGIILFNHEICRDTLALEVADFQDLYKGPIYRERLTGSETCPEYCVHECELKPCPQKCECAWVRDVLDCLSRWPKK
jgi:hypothetical protein